MVREISSLRGCPGLPSKRSGPEHPPWVRWELNTLTTKSSPKVFSAAEALPRSR